MLAVLYDLFHECLLLMCLMIVDPYLILKTLSGKKCNKSATVVKKITIHRSVQLPFPSFSDVTALYLTAVDWGTEYLTAFFTVVGIYLE